MTCSTLQSSLLFRLLPSLSFPSSPSKRHRSHLSLFVPRHSFPPSSPFLCFSPQSPSAFFRLSSILLNSRFSHLPCTFHHDNVASDSDLPNADLPSDFSESGGPDSNAATSDSDDKNSVTGAEESEVHGFQTRNRFVDGDGKSSESVAADSEDQGKAAEVGDGTVEDKKDQRKSKFSVVVLLLWLWAAIRRAVEKMAQWDCLSWWPFSLQEKRLEKLIAEADANPKDATLQGALLVELNKHRY